MARRGVAPMGARAAAPARAVVARAGKDEGGMGSASDGFGAKFIPGFGKQDDKLNQAKLDPKKRLATQDVRDGPLNKGMSEQQFVIFMAILAPVFLSLPLAIALKGY